MSRVTLSMKPVSIMHYKTLETFITHNSSLLTHLQCFLCGYDYGSGYLACNYPEIIIIQHYKGINIMHYKHAHDAL